MHFPEHHTHSLYTHTSSNHHTSLYNTCTSLKHHTPGPRALLHVERLFRVSSAQTRKSGLRRHGSASTKASLNTTSPTTKVIHSPLNLPIPCIFLTNLDHFFLSSNHRVPGQRGIHDPWRRNHLHAEQPRAYIAAVPRIPACHTAAGRLL